MKYALTMGVASLCLMATAAIAQQTNQPTGSDAMQRDTMQGTQPMTPMTAEQQRMVDALPADRRESFNGMTAEMQGYYFTLNAQQQDAWWLLTNDQRMQVYNLQPTQRDAAWTSILQQVSAARMSGQTTDSTSTMAGTGNTASGSAMTSGSMAEPMADSTMTADNTMTADTMAGDSMAATTMNSSAGMTSGNIRFVSSAQVQAVPTDQAPTTGDVPVCRAGQEDNCINQFEATGRGNRPLDSYPGERRTTPRR